MGVNGLGRTIELLLAISSQRTGSDKGGAWSVNASPRLKSLGVWELIADC